MKIKNARELKQFLFDSDGKAKLDNFGLFESATQEGKLGLSNFQLKDLAHAFMGDQWAKAYTHSLAESLAANVELAESDGIPVTSTHFPQITGQLLFSEVRAQHDLEANTLTPLIPVVPSMIKGTEIVPTVTNVDPDDFETVLEGQPYPTVGVTEEYFTLPAKAKKGAILQVTREAIQFDKTGLLVQQAQALGRVLGRLREKELIDILSGQTNNYSRNGTSANTYTTSGVVNNTTGLPLTDWTDIDTAMRLWEDILDPNTSEALAGNPRHLVVMPAKLGTASRILSATQTRTAENASAGTRSEETIGGNPLGAMGLNLQLIQSRAIYRQILATVEPIAGTARDGWFLGNLDEAFAWYEVWPLELRKQGPDSPDAFSRDVTLQFKASYYGVAAVREKRKVLRIENTAW